VERVRSLVSDQAFGIWNNFGLNTTDHEGYVIANAQGYHYDDAYKNIGKFVRANHVTTNDHWMRCPSTISNKNKLKVYK
jgi:hypothetical protein